MMYHLGLLFLAQTRQSAGTKALLARVEWQEAFDRIPKETIDALWEKWTGLDESVKQVPKQDWPGREATLLGETDEISSAILRSILRRMSEKESRGTLWYEILPGGRLYAGDEQR